MKPSDETAITEITIGPDGRIFVFGLSREVLGVLAGLCPGNPVVEDRVGRSSERDRASNLDSVSATNRNDLRVREPVAVSRVAEGSQS